MSKPVAIYQQLMESIEKKIVSSELKIGDKIDSERVMSEKYGINRMTVRNALKHLEEKGILESIRGSGTYVKAMPQIQGTVDLGNQEEILSLSAQIRQRGMKSSRILLSMQKIQPVDEIKEAFQNIEWVYEIIRMSLINDSPYALQKTYIPCPMFNDAERFDFVNGSLYDYMQDRNHRPKTMVSYLQIETLPKEYLQIMEANEKDLYFLFDYLGYDAQNELVEYTISYHHPKFTTFKYKAQIQLD
ncbi:GntR family transcriptional regulator [Floccifex sp.]|uniref:GntR family transcriptional regulator n=1 Tax=Floccifex sp. TaxID=2815810 RepID=UPI003F0DFEC7